MAIYATAGGARRNDGNTWKHATLAPYVNNVPFAAAIDYCFAIDAATCRHFHLRSAAFH